MKIDIHNELEVRRLISPLTQTNADTAIVSQIIDLANVASCELIIAYGNMTDADVTTVVLLEESNDSGMSGANAVDDADLIGTELAAAAAFGDDHKVAKLGYKGIKRYLRLTITPTGNNSGALPVGAVAVLSHERKQPVA